MIRYIASTTLPENRTLTEDAEEFLLQLFRTPEDALDTAMADVYETLLGWTPGGPCLDPSSLESSVMTFRETWKSEEALLPGLVKTVRCEHGGTEMILNVYRVAE